NSMSLSRSQSSNRRKRPKRPQIIVLECLHLYSVINRGGSKRWRLAENEAGIGSAKSEGVRHRIIHDRAPGFARDVVQRVRGFRMLQINVRRHLLIAQSKDRDASFKTTSRSEQVPGHRLRGTDKQGWIQISEDFPDRLCLSSVTQLGRSGMSI